MATAWSDLSCLQQMAKIVMVLAILALLACLIFNCVAIYKASDETWFVDCDDCKQYGGDVECDRCCMECTWKDETFYYITRGYTIAFCILGVLAEMKLELFETYARVCHFYFPRGFWHIFLGLMTVQANVIPEDAGAEKCDKGYQKDG